MTWLPPELESDRFVLRALKESDAKDIFKYAGNENVCKLTTWSAHKSVEDSLKFIQEYAFKKYEEETPEPYGVTLKGEDKVIGTVGAFWSSRKNQVMEIAYALGEENWGQGFIPEAALAIRDYCFLQHKISRLQSRCLKENKVSAKVMEKIGLTYEGTLRNSEVIKGVARNMVYYSMLPKEWEREQRHDKNYVLRLARREDAKEIHMSHMMSIQQLCVHDYNENQLEAWGNRPFNEERKEKSESSIDNDWIWVVENPRGEIQGHCHLHMNKEKQHCELFGLYLNSEMKGKGIGKKLLKQALIKAQEQQFQKLFLNSTKTAAKFYQSQGFKITGNESSHIVRGVEIECIPMTIEF